jgi:hypothetical protein
VNELSALWVRCLHLLVSYISKCSSCSSSGIVYILNRLIDMSKTVDQIAVKSSIGARL